MELTVLAVSSVLLVGVGYAFVQKAQQSPLVVWSFICASLFVLSTRDLFRSRDHDHSDFRPADGASGGRTAPSRRTAPGQRTASDRRTSASRPPARADGGEDPPR